jgi:hypothetical protein
VRSRRRREESLEQNFKPLGHSLSPFFLIFNNTPHTHTRHKGERDLQKTILRLATAQKGPLTPSIWPNN